MARHSLALVWILACAIMGIACTLKLDLSGNTHREVSSLPTPQGDVETDETPLNPAQQARKQEADRYTAEVIYKGGTILASIGLPSGDVLDFVDRSTMEALPYTLPPLPFGPEALSLPEGVQFGVSEWEQIPEVLELMATAAPFHRPSFWPYILGEAPDTTSIEDYLDRYQEGGAPSSAKRLYAGFVSMEPNRGVLGYINQFKPEVEENSFSLIEFTVSCPADGPRQELIGIVISVDRFNAFGKNPQKLEDGDARLHIEYARMVNGKVKYVWDGMDGTFINNPFRIHQPGQKVPVSVLNQSAVEHLTGIFQVSTGDWWIAYNGDLLGYYPASLFTMLNGNACRSAWYGEALNRTSHNAPVTEMGSGNFSEAGIFNAAYVRNPAYFDLNWLSVTPKDEFSMDPYEPLCYNRTILTYVGAPTFSSLFLLGGPGGKDPACKWP